jgi:hypothetical protein
MDVDTQGRPIITSRSYRRREEEDRTWVVILIVVLVILWFIWYRGGEQGSFLGSIASDAEQGVDDVQQLFMGGNGGGYGSPQGPQGMYQGSSSFGSPTGCGAYANSSGAGICEPCNRMRPSPVAQRELNTLCSMGAYGYAPGLCA